MSVKHGSHVLRKSTWPLRPSVPLWASRPHGRPTDCSFVPSRPLSLQNGNDAAAHTHLLEKIAKHNPIATWLTPNSGSLGIPTVLDEMPSAGLGHSTVVFFVTPKLAHLFETRDKNSFEGSALGRIFAHSGRGSQTLRSIMVIVDALPRPDPRMYVHEVVGSEGLAVCVSPTIQTTTMKENIAGHPASIAFTSNIPPSADHLPRLAVKKVAPANTLFINGHRTTIVSREWQLRSDRDFATEIPGRSVQLSQVKLPLYPNLVESCTIRDQLQARLVRLTAPRKIISSMGNVIRGLETQDGKEIMASQELESTVPAFLKEVQQHKDERFEVRVLALTYSCELFDKFKVPGNDDLFSDLAFRLPNTQDNQTLLWRQQPRRLFDLLTSGARLHRVTSGGAGWGKSAGIISLEPRTGLAREDGADAPDGSSDSFDRFLAGSAFSISEDVFPVGHMVQFLASYHDPKGQSRDTYAAPKLEDTSLLTKAKHFQTPLARQTFAIGGSYQPREVKGDEEHRRGSSSYHPQFFGVLSVEPLALSVTRKWKKILSTSSHSVKVSSKHNAKTRTNVEQSSKALIEHEKPAMYETLLDVPNCVLTWSLSSSKGGGLHLSKKQLATRRDMFIVKDAFQPAAPHCISRFAEKVSRIFASDVARPADSHTLRTDEAAAQWLQENFMILHRLSHRFRHQVRDTLGYITAGSALKLKIKTGNTKRDVLLVRLNHHWVALLVPLQQHTPARSPDHAGKHPAQKRDATVESERDVTETSVSETSDHFSVRLAWNRLLRLCRGPKTSQLTNGRGHYFHGSTPTFKRPLEASAKRLVYDFDDKSKIDLEQDDSTIELAERLVLSLGEEELPYEPLEMDSTINDLRNMLSKGVANRTSTEDG